MRSLVCPLVLLLAAREGACGPEPLFEPHKSNAKTMAWAALSDEWRVMLPELSVASAAMAPRALVLGVMLNLKSSPYVANGRLRQHAEAAPAYNAPRIHGMVHTLMRAAATRVLVERGVLEIHMVHDLPSLPPLSTHLNVTLHRLAAPVLTAHGAPIPAQDARWRAYEQACLVASARFCSRAVSVADGRWPGHI